MDNFKRVKVPKFDEFRAINESVRMEMDLYANIVDGVDELKKVYGDKPVEKTGIYKALEEINKLILMGEKIEDQEAQPAVQAQAQGAQAQGAQAQGAQVQGSQAQGGMPPEFGEE